MTTQQSRIEPGHIKPPSRVLLAFEPRGILEIGALLLAAPFLTVAPRGPRHAVVVVPGLGASDRSTVVIRRFLAYLGYEVHGWNRGRNVRPPDVDVPAVAAQVAALRAATQLPVSLVGWSRGGLIAREVSREIPSAVRMVITLGSPFAAANASNVAVIWRRVTGRDYIAPTAERLRRLAEPVPVPSTSIPAPTASWPGVHASSARAATREHRGPRHAYRARIPSARALDHRRPAGAAARNVEAVPAGPARRPVLPASATGIGPKLPQRPVGALVLGRGRGSAKIGSGNMLPTASGMCITP